MKLSKVLTICALAFSVAALQADTLRMRDGRVIDGSFEGADRNDLRFRPGGSAVQHYSVYDVDSISFGGDPGTNSGPYRTNRDTRYSTDPGRNDQYRNDRYRTDLPPRTAMPPATNDASRRDQYGNPIPNDQPPASYSDRGRYSRDNANGLIIPAGTAISVRMIDSVDSDVAHEGDSFRASLDQPLVVDGRTIAERGSDATVEVVRIQQGGRITGREEVALALASFTANGRQYRLNTSNETVSSNSRGRQSAGVIGGTAALGAIIGAIAGGGSGAAIGAASGAAVGTGAQVLRGQRVRVPAETRLSFTLTSDISL